jgi:mRNA (guanine-N7-)-methyltransferase
MSNFATLNNNNNNNEISSTSGSIKSTTTTNSSIVAQHYNSKESIDKLTRTESRIYYLRNFNNWIKSVLINEYINKIRHHQQQQQQQQQQQSPTDSIK